jgi:hypothetical protein
VDVALDEVLGMETQDVRAVTSGERAGPVTG